MIVNLFCDASIDTNKRIACAGCYIVNQNNFSKIKSRYIIQRNATNNSAEILAIWIGVTEAIALRNSDPSESFVFRLFSDSKISLYGLRDWIFSWIKNMKPDGTLISSSGQPVMNQQCFVDIYNMIISNGLYIEFYHQRGHVLDGKVAMDKARRQFITANKITPEALGLSIETISNCNNIVDNESRAVVKAYVNNGVLLPEVEMELINPLELRIYPNTVEQYKRHISRSNK